MDYFSKLCEIMEKEPFILVGATGAVVKDDKILLVKRHNLSKNWGVPGGVQELGESIRETAKREILEETGLDLEPTDLISIFSSPQWDLELDNGGKIQQFTLFFKMEGVVDQVAVQQSEVADWGFFSPDEVPENTMPCCKQKVLDWVAYKGETFYR